MECANTVLDCRLCPLAASISVSRSRLCKGKMVSLAQVADAIGVTCRVGTRSALKFD